MKKMYSLPEIHVNFIKDLAKKLSVAESDVLRRAIEHYQEYIESKNSKKQNQQ